MIITVLLLLFNCGIILCSRPDDSTVIFQRGEGGYYCHKIPYLLRTFSGVLIALAEGRGLNGREACDDYSGTDLVYKRSLDQGKSWSELKVLYSNSTEEETNVIGNASPVQDRETNRIWMPFCRNNEEMFMMYSDDDGSTWSDVTYLPHLVHEDWAWVGVGPPGGLQLSSGRLLLPGYHSFSPIKGDGWFTYGHTVYSDDGGQTWAIGSEEFGVPFLSNECQAVELSNSSVLLNARTLTNLRIQVLSHDGGITFEDPMVAEDLTEPLEGCEGSLVRAPLSNILYFSDPNNPSLVRHNMTVFRSVDDGASWQVLQMVDEGAVAYSSLQVIPPSHLSIDSIAKEGLELLYERSNEVNLVFEPDEIVYWRVPLVENP